MKMRADGNVFPDAKPGERPSDLESAREPELANPMGRFVEGGRYTDTPLSGASWYYAVTPSCTSTTDL